MASSDTLFSDIIARADYHPAQRKVAERATWFVCKEEEIEPSIARRLECAAKAKKEHALITADLHAALRGWALPAHLRRHREREKEEGRVREREREGERENESARKSQELGQSETNEKELLLSNGCHSDAAPSHLKIVLAGSMSNTRLCQHS